MVKMIKGYFNLSQIGKFLLLSLFFHSLVAMAKVPESITLGGVIYSKADENIMGNHKSSTYLQKNETLSNWNSMVAIHYYINERDPMKFAQDKFGGSSKIELIDGNKNNILQWFDTMNSIGNAGDPVTFQQNLWRYVKLNYDKGIMAIEFSQRKMIANQSIPSTTDPISSEIQNDIISLPLDTYGY
mgnify:CR=1 FL=1